jgi:hypothetical protein
MAPQLLSSSRPKFSSKAEFDAYKRISQNSTSFVPRSQWRHLCPGGLFHESADCPSEPEAELEWIPARFGHTAAAVSPTRILFYGGYLCKASDDTTGICTQVILGNDLWEFDSIQARSGLRPFRQLGLDPSMRGVIGQAALTVPIGSGANYQILIFGGAPEMFFVSAVGQQQLPAVLGDEGQMEIRQLLYRVNKVRNSSTSGLGCLSFHSAVRTDTSGILFGGYARNSLTSAVYTHDLNFRAPSSTLSLVSPIAETPSARGYSGLAKATSTSLVMFGGTGIEYNTSSCADSQCCGSTRGVWDIWSLDVSRQSWSKLASNRDPTLLSFGGFASFFFGEILAINMMGGILCGYKSGVTFTDQYSSCLLSSQCNHHPTSKVQAIAIESNVASVLIYLLTLTDSMPEPRCMQTLQFGNFVEQKDSIIMYGGLSGLGLGLSDMWYYTVPSGADLFRRVPVILSGVTQLPFNTTLMLSILQQVPGCNADSMSKYSIITVESVSGNVVQLSVAVAMSDMESCLVPLAMVPALFARLSEGTILSGARAVVNLFVGEVEIHGSVYDYLAATPDSCTLHDPGMLIIQLHLLSYFLQDFNCVAFLSTLISLLTQD